ncbi:hypothetical protein M8436_15260, partial [Staphylococcus aureus]|uniref:hypothetical protein n=1 Tax=Staphylococcus aureus TaxID=1280 RepID=UPI002020339D
MADLQPSNICVEIGQDEIKRKLLCHTLDPQADDLTARAGLATGGPLDAATPTIQEDSRVQIIDLGVGQCSPRTECFARADEHKLRGSTSISATTSSPNICVLPKSSS